MSLEFLHSDKAPAAVGPYAQAVEVNGFVFVSGQLPINMETGEMETDIRKATLASLSNLKSIVEEAGLSIDNVAKTTVFMKDLEEFTAMNEVYAEFFGSHTPARSTFQVAKLPKDAVVEIEAIVSK